MFSMHLHKAFLFTFFAYFNFFCLLYELSKLSELRPNNWNHILWIIVLRELHRYFDLRIDLRATCVWTFGIYPSTFISGILSDFTTSLENGSTNVCNTKTRRNESAPEQSRWRDKEKTETRQRYRQSRWWHIGRRWRRYR